MEPKQDFQRLLTERLGFTKQAQPLEVGGQVVVGDGCLRVVLSSGTESDLQCPAVE